MLIFKIFRAEEWQSLVENGATDGAPIDVADGCVPFSTAEQVAETPAKHFEAEDGLVLLALASDALAAALAWAVSRGDAPLPHTYLQLRFDELLLSTPFP